MTKERSDLDFMSDLEAMKHLQPKWSANAMLYVVAALVVLFIVWASFSKVEIIVRGSGQVVPSSELQVVQSLEGGILAELYVQEGDLVQKDQPLAKIGNVAFDSEERGMEARYHALKLKEMRLMAESKDEDFAIPEAMKGKFVDIEASEMALHASRRAELENAAGIMQDKITRAEASMREVEAQLGRWEKNKGLLGEELRLTRNLAAQNAVPKLDAIRLEREWNDLIGNIEAGTEKRASLEAELSVAQKELADLKAKYRSQALTDLSETQAGIAAMQESLTSAGDRVDRTQLRAPVAGIVKTVAVKTIGGIVEPAMKVIEIVPVDDELKITARVNPADIAFLKKGQAVKVKVSAYDSQRYGALDGTLSRISADSVTERDKVFFEIDVRTQKNYLGTEDAPLPIMPGMIAETEIITGKRSIMGYLLKPVIRAKDRALTEK